MNSANVFLDSCILLHEESTFLIFHRVSFYGLLLWFLGEILVTPSYLSVLTDIANRRFALNAERLQRLEDSVRTALAALPAPSPEDVARTTSAMAQPGAGWSAAVSSSSSPASTRAVATTPTTITSATATVETAAAAARETTLAARAAIAAASGKSSASSSLVSGPPLPGSKAAGRLAKSARVAAAKASAKALKRAAKLNSNSGNTNTGISGRSSGSSSSSSIVDDCRLRSNIRNHELSSTIPDEKLASVSSRTVNENPEWAGPGWAASVALLNSSSKLGEDTTALDNNSRRDSNSEFDPCQWTILSFGGFGPCQDGGSVRRLSACKTLRGTTCDYKVAAGAPMNVTVASATVADTAATGAEPCPREGSALATLFECGTTSSSDADPLLSPMAVLFGGRESPTKPLGDAWCWREDISLEPRNSSSNSSRRSSSGIWRALRKPSSSSLKSGSDDHHHHLGTDVAGEWPCPRWGHTLTSVGPGMLLLLGGRDHLGTVGINKNGSEDDIRDGRGAAYLLIAHCEGNIIKDGWRWERLSVTATAGADATNFSLARFDHSATLVPTAAANRTFKGAQATSTVVVYGGWHDAAVDVQPSASLLVLDLKIDFNDGKQIPKVDVCEVRRLLCVAHRWSMLVASKDERMNMLRRASHAAVALVTHFVVFGGAGDITAGDDSLSAFALPWAPLLCQDGDHNDSMVLAEAIQWANESHSRSGGGFLEAFVKGSAVPLPPAPPAPWSTLMSPGSLSSTPHEVTNATNSSKSNGGSQASSSNSMVVNAAAWAVGTPPCSARGEQRALLLGGGLPLLGFGPHFCAHTSPIASCVTLRFASGYGESFSREDRATSTGEASLAQNSSTIASSSNRMVHTAWLEPMSLIGETSSTKAPPESSAHADGAASPSVSWAASVRARSRRKQGAAAVAQSGQSAIPAVLPASLSNNAVGSRTIAGATTQKNNMHVDKRESNTGDVAPCEVLAAPSNATKKLKAALEASGFLHKGWRIAPAASAIPDILAASTAATSHATSSDGESTPDYAGWLALPLTDDGAAVVDAAIAAIAAMSNAANDAAAGCDKAAAQAAAEASGASSKLAAALVGAMQSAASTITKAANLPDGPDTGASSNSGDSTFSAHFSLWSSLLRGRAVDGGLPLNKAKLFGQRSKLESAVVALLLEAHRCDLSSDSNNNNNIKQTEAALRKAVLSSSLFAGNTNLERVGDTAILLPETCLPPSELAQWPWSLLSASLNDACSSEGKGSSSCSQKLSSNGSETPVDGPGAIALLWKCIATSHNVRLIARAARIDDGPKRASRVRLLYAARLAPLPSSSSSSLSSSYPPSQSLCGVDEEGRSLSAGPHSAGWCSVREHGISFSFDITRVMFCSGNVTERKRMAAPPTSFAPHAKYGEATQLADRPANAAAASATSSTGPASATAGDAARPKHSTPSGPWDALLPSPPQSASQACVEQQARCAAEGGEVIVDLYGGIGYYTLPFLVHFGHKVSSEIWQA